MVLVYVYLKSSPFTVFKVTSLLSIKARYAARLDGYRSVVLVKPL